MQAETLIFPTTRAIRHELLSLKKSTLFLQNYITVSEFIERACIVEGFTKIDSDTRLLLLLEASDFKEFESLHIERNFFTFTQNSSYIFSLFTELGGEKVELDDLELADTYGDYEEHIAILKILYKKYEVICREKKIFDPIFLPKSYKFNAEYVKTLGEIRVVVEGYLTAFEIEILQKCSEVADLKVEIATTAFNQKIRERFKSLGFSLEGGYTYLLDFNGKKILDAQKIFKNTDIECSGFSERLLQAAFVKQKVYEYIQKGLKPEDIVVILPNESFASILRLYDDQTNFNFAMGEDFKRTEAYMHLNAVCEYIENPTVQNGARVQRYGSSFYELLSPIYYADMKKVDFKELIERYTDSLRISSHKKVIEEELYGFVRLKYLYEEFNLRSTLHLFMQRLAQRSVDDVRGGKITVMGVLESRYVRYKGVIMVDFNDSDVPKRSEKDLFLNSDIRALANLPTQNDRENLQKHYYALLIDRAQYVSISYVASTSSMPSRFLTQLGIETKEIENEAAFAAILHKNVPQEKKESDEEITGEYDFSKIRLSATSLKTFLECRRRYYNRYIMQLEKHEFPQDFPTENKIGQDLHEALRNVYLKRSVYTDKRELQSAIYKELERISGSSSLEHYQLKLWNKKLNSFVENEMQRFEQGYAVYDCEKSLTCKFAGMELTGQIDRIDIKEEKLFVLDYKSGKYPSYTTRTLQKATDFQLEFYYLLASTIKKVDACGYYDLNSGKIVDETLLEEKLELLQRHLKEMLEQKSFSFDKTEDESKCQYCEFVYLCGRG
ncbi:PD-(D/E)XK nuclease family protein [Sulfurimonas sp. HSL-1716]|uniref:PD-(D/E)XK nuclease family protein n=1 Tax=Hydrocurvibacter sulfurireducens TaxID=3131937 RepID=UPI0031F7D442